jgi:hypothetical protein
VNEGNEKIALGGLGFALESRDPVIAAAAHTHFAGYLDPRAEWPLVFEGRDPKAFAPVSGLVCGRVGNTWELQVGAELALHLNESGGRAWVAKDETFFPPGSLQNVLRLCLALRGRLLLHAASVVHRGRAFVFAGKSGQGKSTLARTFSHSAMLGDEIACLADGRAYRVPFTGERLPPPSSLDAPLGAICMMEQASTFAVKPASWRDVLPHVFNPTHDRAFSRALVDRVLGLVVPLWKVALPRPSSETLTQQWLDRICEMSEGTTPWATL